MVKPWNEFRQEISKLYKQEGRTLAEVRTIMKERHDFDASVRSYRQHFDQWDVQKYKCKKREERRQQQQQSMPLSPPRTPHLSLRRHSAVRRHSAEMPSQAPLDRRAQPATLSPGHGSYSTSYYFGQKTASDEHRRASIGQQSYFHPGTARYEQTRLPHGGGCYERPAISPGDSWYTPDSSESPPSIDDTFPSLFDQERHPHQMPTVTAAGFPGQPLDIRYMQTPIIG